ncbi:MAG: UDP-N-acetylmuramoyl-L-alanyl-D-glutamate--2,6-diaminopimelate ligase [Chloroflexi bacterium]|nr:UDP-N-acetylmuramoyl-L-alanyl-D-glutamate--2,6-diaminopimelate ligase [Chloroflexota bacterium]
MSSVTSNPLVTGITYDSRQIEPGNIFVALEGKNTDGHRFIRTAIEQGAAAIAGCKPFTDLDVPYIRVADPRHLLAYLSAAFYNFPARKMSMIGVTGTDGKTTTTNLIYEILLKAGTQAGMISTVNATIGDEVIDTGFHVTTPEAPEVQRYLSRMQSAGLTHVVLETTSHGLEQHRVSCCEFDVGVITNITHEHLDYHGSYEAYWKAKSRLFTGLAETAPKSFGNPRLAVLNLDDRSYEYLNNLTSVNKITYSCKDPQADVFATNIQHSPNGLHFDVKIRENVFPIRCLLIGEHNVSNCLAAAGAAYFGLGIGIDSIVRGIESLKGIPGRMELIDRGQDFIAIVDFAHTPNALLRALEAARQLTAGRILVVFGSAGLRDREKRRLMAEIAVQWADMTYLTAEDPRTESLDDILAEMADAAEKRGGIERETFWRVADRGQAILQAVKSARPGDVVIACGKGHEQSMCFGEVEYPWDDRVAMRAALAQHLGLEGPKMPYLPTRN